MKRPLLGTLVASLLALTAASSCQNTGKDINDHWNADSLPPRISRYMLGYNPEKDGAYRDFAWRRKQSIQTTLRRYLLHLNPDNPNHPEVPSRFGPRPINSALPNPWYYVHFEGLALGLGTLIHGSFFPIPVDSIIGTFDHGGVDEFMVGMGVGFRPVGVVVSSFTNTWIDPPLEGAVTTFAEILD